MNGLTRRGLIAGGSTLLAGGFSARGFAQTPPSWVVPDLLVVGVAHDDVGLDPLVAHRQQAHAGPPARAAFRAG